MVVGTAHIKEIAKTQQNHIVTRKRQNDRKYVLRATNKEFGIKTPKANASRNQIRDRVYHEVALTNTVCRDFGNLVCRKRFLYGGKMGGKTEITLDMAEFCNSNCWACTFAPRCKHAIPLPCFEEKDESREEKLEDVVGGDPAL